MVSLQMAIAMTILSAIIGGTAFSAISYGFNQIGGRSGETERHDRAMEKFNADNEAYDRAKKKYEAWQYDRKEGEQDASDDFNDVDGELKFYNKMHPDEPKFSFSRPNFSNYYSPPPEQKNGELIYVSIGMLGAGYLVSKII